MFAHEGGYPNDKAHPGDAQCDRYRHHAVAVIEPTNTAMPEGSKLDLPGFSVLRI
ncbi:hypothetical protein [Mesorhizobium sp. B2-6-4]|uniref:hypothetical protein n=1 Tax=Mesorhizobium sp. B2-6-4 TaxID=2589913 RepID=UPI0015E3471C|nr:hypothetical protein [Mesorhizobium sp. B2-6-4]